MAFLDVLLSSKTEDGKGLSTEGIVDEVNTFLVAGHETTAGGLLWLLFALGHHLDVQERLYEEITGITEITAESLKQLTYMDQVIKESQRLMPVVPFTGRHLTEPVDFGDGCVIPTGTSVLIPIYSIHRHPGYWKNPDTFDPDRFSTENSIGRHPFSFIPFAAGKRNCIGQKFAWQEMKVVLATFLRSFSVVSHQLIDEVELEVKATMKPKHPLDIEIRARH